MTAVMAGLDPAITSSFPDCQDVDAGTSPGMTSGARRYGLHPERVKPSNSSQNHCMKV
jgi:hypothetical protein